MTFPEVPLSEILSLANRPETPAPGKLYRQIGVRLWGEGAYEREPIDGAATQYQRLFQAKANDVIVNKIWARNGSVAVVPGPLDGCYGSNEFPMFIPRRERLEPRWFHWLTKTKDFWAKCDEKSRGTSGKNRIRPERFLEIEIPLPTLSVQRRIAGRIDNIASRVKEAYDYQLGARGEAEKFFTTTRATILQRAILNKSQRLDCAVSLERGKFSYRPRNEPRFFGGRHPWIQIAEIEAANKHIRAWSQTLNDEGLSISRKFPKGTILISIAATIGAVGILDFDCCVPDSIVAVTPRQGNDTEFVYHYLAYLRAHLEEVAPQSAQKNINLRILAQMSFPELPFSEQRRMVEYLNNLEAKVDTLRDLQSTVSGDFEALLPSILDKAFSGQL
jgi:type I restriction enzyme S subunit